jgi:hypothetical protein
LLAFVSTGTFDSILSLFHNSKHSETSSMVGLLGHEEVQLLDDVLEDVPLLELPLDVLDKAKHVNKILHS